MSITGFVTAANENWKYIGQRTQYYVTQFCKWHFLQLQNLCSFTTIFKIFCSINLCPCKNFLYEGRFTQIYITLHFTQPSSGGAYPTTYFYTHPKIAPEIRPPWVKTTYVTTNYVTYTAGPYHYFRNKASSEMPWTCMIQNHLIWSQWWVVAIMGFHWKSLSYESVCHKIISQAFPNTSVKLIRYPTIIQSPATGGRPQLSPPKPSILCHGCLWQRHRQPSPTGREYRSKQRGFYLERQ